MLNNIKIIIEKIREQRPLIHHITNYVTANDSANITLAIGASPVMAGEIKEVEQMAGQASALVLNIGTLSALSLEAMVVAGREAAAKGIPVIFDPVGAGATDYRTGAAKRILEEVRPDVIRGNMSEIAVLAGMNADIRGVDSVADESNAQTIAGRLSLELGCVVALTGKTDIIVSGSRVCRLDNGHIMLTRVTGTGCMASSLIGSCCSVTDAFSGAVTGTAIMGVAGELAQQALRAGDGAGTFRMKLFDVISHMNGELLSRHIRLS